MTKPIFDVFREAMERKPSASRKEALDWFVGRIKAESVYLEELAIDYFQRMSSAWTVRDERHGYSFGRAAPLDMERVRKRREETNKRASEAVSDLKMNMRAVILLDLMLPNGKALRHATGAECAKAGGFYAEIAKHIKPTQVVDRHLTEGNLQDIRARFFRAAVERKAS